jgi:hypothetical protein
MKDKIFKAAMVLFLASLLATLFFGILAIRGCRHIVQQAHPTITLHAIPATETIIMQIMWSQDGTNWATNSIPATVTNIPAAEMFRSVKISTIQSAGFITNMVMESGTP